MAHLFNIRLRHSSKSKVIVFTSSWSDAFGSYMDLTSVTDQVTQLRNRTNVSLYYTTDEPDGSEDPFSDPASAAAQINSLDLNRQSSPVLNLNCQGYFFSEYAANRSTSVLMQDTPVGVNVVYSVVLEHVSYAGPL
jgi:hypothetical protein